MKRTLLKNDVIDMTKFYREQMISQCEQLTAVVREIHDERVSYRPFHDALNEALYILGFMQFDSYDDDDMPF